MKRLLILLFFVFFAVGAMKPGNASAGEIDILLEKLVEKGILTPAEAQQIGTETKEQVKKEIAAGKSSSLPQWAQNTKLKGDLRLRYQLKHEKAANDYSKDTQTGRVRMRLGLESKINEKLLAGIGIATNDGGDPRSTNITFGGGGYSSKMEIRLDYAFAKYNALPWLKLVGGKMLANDAFWEPTDLIWDTDITPEGAVIALNRKLGPNATAFVNTGVLIEEADTSTNSDPMTGYFIQPAVEYRFNGDFSLKGAFAFYDFSNVKGKAYPTASWYKSSNTKIGANWRYDYQMFSPALEFNLKDPFKPAGLNVEELKLFGEYVNNLAVSSKASGFSLGFQFGNAKIEKWGDWQFRYIYAMLGKDAVIDTLPDSDRYGGKTGIRSHEAAFSFGLGKNTFLGADVYRSWSLIGAKAPETLVQVDWNMKF